MLPENAIELSGVTLRRGESELLSGLDWVAARGENWAILGPNGAGKTLLLQVVTGYLWPTDGTVCVLGSRLGTVDLRELRKRIGWVSPAIADLMPGRTTLIETILSGPKASLGLYDDPDPVLGAKAEALAESFGLSGMLSRYFGLLSSGEKQRALLARAALAEPELLILDEPMSNLDMGGRELFLEHVRVLAAKEGAPTIILTTHNTLEIGPFISHALIVKQGKDLAKGKVSDIVTTEWLTEAFGLPLKVERTKGGRFLATLAGS
ncbi:MAG: ATP-binding cassette domain-containing protein [Deltaproteobacteria bacterium]|jgi:iron complex transport system ATP-binding protein|nr:ATP-binding cassette domain-containing protein [Deltaproteobacteria bacterium]